MNKQNLDAIFADILLKFRPAHLLALYLLFVYFAIDGERDPVLRYIEQATTSAGLMIPGYFWKHSIFAACILIALARPFPLVAFTLSAPLIIFGYFAFRYGVVNGISPSILTLMVIGFFAVLAVTVATQALIASENERHRLIKENGNLAKQLLDSQPPPQVKQAEQVK